MGRYVDANWLLGVAGLSKGVIDVDDIYNAPSVDICLCRECKAYDSECEWCKGLGLEMKADDFCSYGERSEDE